jgi:hypothetical protein
MPVGQVSPASPAIGDQPIAVTTAIANGRNGDGGWGYFRSKASRLEPTAWVSLTNSPLSDPAREWLAGRQTADGWLVDVPAVPVNYGFNGLALMALLAGGQTTPITDRLTERIVGVKGLAVAQSPALRQDNSLQAWSWVEGTFSWVEPTAYCLLGVKRARGLGAGRHTETSARVDEAERMLADRACAGGGWNYGNANAFDKDLRPHGPTTALALLALQDRRDLPCVQTGLQFLTAHAERERSGLALALSLICLRAFGVDHAALRRAAIQQIAVSLAMGNHATLGALLAALRDDDHAVEPFRI